MSGPVRDVDLAGGTAEGPPAAGAAIDATEAIEAIEGRSAEVGGLAIRRVLPTKGHRTVGAWCFLDLLGPADLDDPDPMEVGPHPHTGLATVTWLLEGEALHTDSLGTEQVIRAGELNLMTAGHGISHAELAARPPFRGAQLWIAQPEATRHGPSRFAHHAELPRLELPGERDATTPGTGGARVQVFVGALEGIDGRVVSPASVDTELLGADLVLEAGTTLVPVDPRFELAVAPLDGTVRVGDEFVAPGWLALVPPGVEELPISTRTAGARVLLIGGVPLGEPIAMWWNFVARDREELTAAWHDWNARTDRFGTVASPLERLEAPAPPWVRTA